MVDPAAVRRHISDQRLATYGAGQAPGFALRNYEWNIALSAAVYESLHRVEVAIRNAMDRELASWNSKQLDRPSSSRLGRTWLVKPAPLLRRLLGPSWHKAQARCSRECGLSRWDQDRAHVDVLAQLPFSTWRFLLPDRDPGRRLLWEQATHRAFPGWQGDSFALTNSVAGLVRLRNRVAHLEPIIQPGYVERQFVAMRRVTAAIDPAAEAWLLTRQRITPVLHRRPKAPTLPKGRVITGQP